MTNKKKNLRPALYIIISLLSLFLFLWCREIALKQRGDEAIGGEYFLLNIPLLVRAAELTIRGIIKAVRNTEQRR
jgi:hypothetical protein